MVYDAVTQKKRKKEGLRRRKEEENVSLRFPFAYSYILFLPLVRCQKKKKKKKKSERESEGEKQKLSFPLETNQLDFFSHFFCSVFTTYSQIKKKKVDSVRREEFPFLDAVHYCSSIVLF